MRHISSRQTDRGQGQQQTTHLHASNVDFHSGLPHTLNQVITNPQRIGDDGQRGVNGTTGRKEAAIHHVEIIDIVGLTIQIQHGGCGVFAKLTGADLVTDAFH